MKLSTITKTCALTAVFCSVSFGQFWTAGTEGTGKQYISPYYNGAYYNILAQSPSGWAKAGDTAVVQFGASNNTVKATFGKGISINPYGLTVPAIFTQEVTGNVGIGTATPTATLFVNGSIAYKMVPYETPYHYQITPNDNLVVISCNVATDGPKLPDLSSCGEGKVITIKNTWYTPMKITVSPAGTLDMIESAGGNPAYKSITLTPTANDKSVCIQLISANRIHEWFILSHTGNITYSTSP